MAKFRVPSYRKHTASKQAIVTLRGKTYYLGKYGTAESKRKYDELISDYLKQRGQPYPPVRSNSPSAASNLTVVEACDRYLAHVQSRFEHSRHAKAMLSHVKALMQVLLKLYENERAAAFGPLELLETRRAMIALDWSRSYVNSQIAKLCRMYKWLVTQSLVPETTYRALKLVEGLRKGEEGVRETKPVRSVADKIVDATIPHLPERYCQLLWMSSLRRRLAGV